MKRKVKATKGPKRKAKARPKTSAGARRKTPADSRRSTHVVYAYGFVPESFDAAGAPGGLDESPVVIVRGPKHGALVSHLSTASYAAEAVERSTADVNWLSPRAMAHDRVLTWAQEHGGVLPLPMFSLWGSDTALSRALATRDRELTRVFAKVAGADEFGVRVYRREDVLLENLDGLDPEIARLKREAGAAPPGQRYLLERKIAEHGKQAVRAASHRLAKQVFDELRLLARDALARPLTPESGRAPEATLVLNGAFLVERAQLNAFRAALGERVRAYQPRGLTFDFSGPWPPYNFAVSGPSAKSKRAK